MIEKRIRIVVIVDLSVGSEHLVDFGFNLSGMIKANILFVHQVLGVFPAMTGKEQRDKIYQNEIQEAKDKLRKLVRGRVIGNESFIVSEKPILTTLNEIKSSYYKDWVVGGLKVNNLFKRILFGSTFIKVINYSSFLTVAVPISNAVSIPKKILVAVTPKYSLNEAELENLISEFHENIKVVEFLTIIEDGDDKEIAINHLTKLQNKYSKYSPNIVVLKGGDKYIQLKKHLENNEQAFLILQEGSRSFIDHLLRKYMINDIIHAGNIPLIVLPNE
ncbi:universal stress protein [Pararhodonellum marinum]|uniref:universal stress protein n=1 Tax=Pararhodonellum marinum TaxID=2755358 RepID=UPI00188E45A2|nr:universal stress protein [Pararhodonellum marinum]